MQEGNWECKICMEEAKDAVATRCGHLYCWQCVFQWQQTKGTDIFPCPVCHAEVALGDLIPLFTSQSQHQERLRNLPSRPRTAEPQFQDEQQGGFWINGVEINMNLNRGFLQTCFFFFIPIAIYVLPLFIDFVKTILNLTKSKKPQKTKAQLLRDYREFRDLGITFEEYLEFVNSEDNIDLYIYLGFFVLFLAFFIYRKIRQRRLRLFGRP